MIQHVLTQQSKLQDNLQAPIDQQVKDNILSALTEYTSSTEDLQEKVVNNVSTQAKDASTEAILDMIATLTKKVEELKRPENTHINPRTGKKFVDHADAIHIGEKITPPPKKMGHQDSANFKN